MTTSSNFYNLGIAPSILAILDRIGFVVPTPIQEQSIPPALDLKDLIGIAQTGTGQTLAFGIPMIQNILLGARGLVVLPTRELALQIEETLSKITKPLRIRTTTLIGGAPMNRQIKELRRDPHIIFGTPGRIIDHLERKTLYLDRVKILVLDEADRILDMGFAPQLKRILEVIPKNRHTMLFSATMPNDIVTIAHKYMKMPTRVEIAPQGTAAEKITQELFFTSREDKPRLLEKILSEYRGSVLVFTRTKYGARRLATSVRRLGHTAAELHSNRSLAQRKDALEKFKNGKYRVLIATDIAARGIDVKGIELVINYDLPQTPSDYVHRIGRTGRAGSGGHAISFATPDQHGKVRGIERFLKAALPLSEVKELPPLRKPPSQEELRSQPTPRKTSPQRKRRSSSRSSSRSNRRGSQSGRRSSGRSRRGRK